MKKLFYAIFLCVSVISFPIFAAGAEKFPSGIKHAEIPKIIEAYVLENEKTTAGLAVGVFTQNKILYEGYHGYSDRENGIASNKNTVMEWGSATKILVWVSVMQLVEKGELSLSEDITKYLPKNFLTKLRYDKPLTMYNLMHHNAGWEESILELFVFEEKNITDLETALRRAEPNQIFAPEEFIAYSNWSVALAAYIVERITGQPFYAYVHENIFEILGMEHTALNANLSDNEWVKKQRNRLNYYSATGAKLGIPHIYIPLYPAGMGIGTLADFIRFAMALIPDEAGKSPLFEEKSTLDNFYTTSLYYADGKTPRNSHGLWAGYYSVPVIGHGGKTSGCSSYLRISPSARVGVVIMTNQSKEGVYNYGIMPMVFGDYQATKSNMPAVDELEGVYINTRSIFSGMLKCFQLTSVLPFVKSGENELSCPLLPQFFAEQIEPYTYRSRLGDIRMTIEANVNKARTTFSVPMFDFVKISFGLIIFWAAMIIAFAFAAFYAIISLSYTLLRRMKHTLPEYFGKFEKFRMLNDVSILFSLINASIFILSVEAYRGRGVFLGTHASTFFQGILFIIFALIPVIFTITWIVNLRKHKATKWQIASSITGLIMTANVIFWDLYVIW